MVSYFTLRLYFHSPKNTAAFLVSLNTWLSNLSEAQN